MNPAYKHLDSKLRVAELTIGQWIAVLLGVSCGIAWGMYLSPFGPTLTLTLGIYVAAVPVGAAVVASLTEFDPWLTVKSAFAWRRLDGRFLPGPGRSAHGYTVVEETEVAARALSNGRVNLDYSSLWEAS